MIVFKHLRLHGIVFITLLSFFTSCNSYKSEFSPVVIKCNLKRQATGVNISPSFSWELRSTERNQSQAAYRVLIANNIADLKKDVGNVFDSEQSFSNQSVNVSFNDLKLEPGTRYYWKVRVWNKDTIASEWSNQDSFITGLFTDKSWEDAKWISHERTPDSLIMVPGIPTWGHNTKGIATRRAVIPQFRKEFSTDKEIQSAYLFVSGIGHYKAWINGSELSASHMDPGWTDYEHTCLYNTYDVTKVMNRGDNAIGLLVGTGFYNINNERYRKLLITYGMPKAIAKLCINYSNGTSETIVTDTSWKSSASPITYSSIYGGENYDARLEQDGWNREGFDDSGWQKVLLAKQPGGDLKPAIAYPIKRVKTFPAIRTIEKGIDTFAFDFGQNAAGIVEIQLKGNKGDTVRIYPSELYFEELKENQRWTGWPHYYEYVLKGDGVETYSPRFTYYGLRYAHVIGAQPTKNYTDTKLPEIVDVKMHHISNSAPEVGSFWCSNPLFNRIDTLIKFAIRSNLQSVATDCPHRERLGWLEQTHLMGNSIKYNYELYHLYTKIVDDMVDAQYENGFVPNFAPEYIVFGGPFSDSPEWGSAVVQLPWLIYKWYGDMSVMEKAWESMVNYMKYLDSKAENNIISYGLGDWYDVGPEPPGFSQLSPKETTATAFYYYNYTVLAKMAGVLDKPSEEEVFGQKAESIRKAYNNRLFNPEKAIYATGSQSAMAIPLSLGIVEKQYEEAVLGNLVETIISDNKRITSGDIGFHFLIDALVKGNYSQLVYEMNNREDVPGYGYQLKKGATALAESWEALESKSNNHLMLGHIMEWFYTALGGIQQQENSVAFKETIIKPTIINGLEEVKTSHNTPYGKIVSEWKDTEQELEMYVEIPVNTTALIFIPSSDYDIVKVNNILLESNRDIEVIDKTHSYTKIKAGSGGYKIKVSKD